MKSNYKRLGDYIRPIDVRNKDLQVTRLLGVSIEKRFIESIANTIGTDLSTYKIVKKGQFAYGPVTSRNGEKVSIALLEEDSCIISSSYSVFEIIDTELLLPEYLNLWFKRPEFDRYARFHSHGSAREIFDWEEMCNVELPILEIDEQRRIVNAYNTIEHRIELKHKINENLEEQANSIYKNLSSLDSSSYSGTIEDLANKIVCGKTPSTKENDNFGGDIPFITIPDMHDNVYALSTERTLTVRGASCTIPENSVCVSCIASAGLVCLTDTISQTNQQINSVVCKKGISPYYVYLKMKELSEYIKQIGSCGSTTCNLSKTGFANIDIQIPSQAVQIELHKILSPVFKQIKQNQKELNILIKMKSLLLCRLPA